MDNWKGRERRMEEREDFTPDSVIFAHIGPRAFQVLNISSGGLSFFSDTPFEKGEMLLMSAQGMIALDVEVLSCEMEEVDAVMMDYKYRVRAKFGPHVNAYQVSVLTREMRMQNERKGGGSLQVSVKPQA